MDLRVGFPEPWRSGLKQQLLRVEALTGAGEKKSYVRLLGYLKMRRRCKRRKGLTPSFVSPIEHHGRPKSPTVF
jgi:hypothetical protein